MSRARRAARRADRDGARGDGSTRARSHRGPKVPLMPALRCSCRRAYRRRMEIDSPLPGTEPPRDCPRCPRLVALRRECRAEYPDWWNARSEEHTSELQSLMRMSYAVVCLKQTTKTQ